MEFSRELGRVLLEEAKRQKMSVRKVGDLAGNRNALFKLVRKEPATVTVETFHALATALGLSVSDLAYRVEKRLG